MKMKKELLLYSIIVLGITLFSTLIYGWSISDYLYYQNETVNQTNTATLYGIIYPTLFNTSEKISQSKMLSTGKDLRLLNTSNVSLIYDWESYSDSTYGIAGPTPIVWACSNSINGNTTQNSWYYDKSTENNFGNGTYNNSACSPYVAGIWHLGESSGTGSILRDSSGNGGTGTMSINDNFNSTYTKFGYYISDFNLPSMGLSYIPHSAYLNVGQASQSFAFTYWFKTYQPGDSNWHRLLMKRNSGGSITFYSGITSDNYLSCGAYDGTNYPQANGPYNSSVYDGNWHYLACQRDYGNKWRLYFDGNLWATATDTAGVITNTQSIYILGGDGFAFGGTGAGIDEIRIYTGVNQSDAFFKREYQNGLTMNSLGSEQSGITNTCSLDSSGWNTTYGSTSNVTCYASSGTPSCQLYKNDTLSAYNNSLIKYGVAGYKWNCNATGTTSQIGTYISIATPTVTISGVTNSTYPYSETIYTTSNDLNGLSLTFVRNGTANANNTAIQYGVGLWNFTSSTVGNANYSATSISSWNLVNQATPTLSIFGITNSTYPYSQTIYATSNDNEGLSITLVRNGTSISNNTAVQYGAGLYNFTASVPANQNFTSASVSVWNLINQATSSCSVIPITSTVSNTQPVLQYCSSSNKESACKLYRNGTDITAQNNTSPTHTVGDYAFIGNTSSSQNYTSCSASSTLNVIASAPLPHITLPLNSTVNITTITYNFYGISFVSTTFHMIAYNDGSVVYDNSAYPNNTAISGYMTKSNGSHNFTIYADDGSTNSTSVIYKVNTTYTPTTTVVEQAPSFLMDLFSTNLIYVLIYSGGLSAIVIGTAYQKHLMRLKKDPSHKLKIPTLIFLLVFTMFYVYFASNGLADPFYVIIPVLLIAGLLVYFANNLFLGQFGTLDKMFISYMLFFLTVFYFVNTSVVQSFNGSIPTLNAPTCSGPSDAPIIGALVNFVNWFSCGASYYFGIIQALFGISSSIQILNTVLVVPMIFVSVLEFVEKVKP